MSVSFGLLFAGILFCTGVIAGVLSAQEHREIKLPDAEADESTDPVVRSHLKWFRIYGVVAIVIMLMGLLFVFLNMEEAQQLITDFGKFIRGKLSQ